MALVQLSVVEQRLDAVRAVLAGAQVKEVASSLGVSRQSVHGWLARYLVEGVPGLADRSHRPHASPQQAGGAVEVRVAEMRRQHPRWGAKRIRMELLRKPPVDWTIPATRTINRILVRQGLVIPRKRKRPRESYQRWERPSPMQLWQLDIVGGVMLVDPVTGALREAKVVTGVDDHSRFCVIASVVEHATGRAVCLALAAALRRYGVPEEILTDNGKQFTDRFGKGGEVLFDKICRHNAITHRLTQPASPTTTGKIERFHLTLRRELLDDHEPFESLTAAQTAVDGFVAQYNADRPHQALDAELPVTPAERFTPIPEEKRELLELWLPPVLAPTAKTAEEEEPAKSGDGAVAVPVPWAGGPVELDRIVPPSGNMQLAGKQFWLGPNRSGQVVRFWASVDMIHLLIGGAKVKTVRSHLTVNDLAKLFSEGAVNAGLSPMPPVEDGAAVEVDRSIGSGGITSLGGKVILAAEILAGRRVGIRIEPRTLMFFDLETRALLRTQAEPTHPRPGRQVAREPASRAATPSLGGADPGPTPSIERRHHLCLQTESGARPDPPIRDRHRLRVRHHPGHRARRPRNPCRAPHHHHAGH